MRIIAQQSSSSSSAPRSCVSPTGPARFHKGACPWYAMYAMVRYATNHGHCLVLTARPHACPVLSCPVSPTRTEQEGTQPSPSMVSFTTSHPTPHHHPLGVLRRQAYSLTTNALPCHPLSRFQSILLRPDVPHLLACLPLPSLMPPMVGSSARFLHIQPCTRLLRLHPLVALRLTNPRPPANI
ncbi:uncharacterized protein K460DRAFT_1745 [Cucurbitaria berberidis CBS 394.84]|uniref:Uncharacterized protein n=1 Tax=Cucurbitaria berberidis CBS 394.84 TaxID=1168544 RepID=A0A9P4GQX0_9PLEO|nr:uncharacterized protein K460DRAFT_1745 [Cucurbitaria berberidis CBS 394.84]KAF1849669.1 hypothetical protein K460DRAFT_1745 [Cucurbitaria berberidis CBS 394.84]